MQCMGLRFIFIKLKTTTSRWPKSINEGPEFKCQRTNCENTCYWLCGFIGFHLAKKLLSNKKYLVFGIDNINNYCDANLKKRDYLY